MNVTIILPVFNPTSISLDRLRFVLERLNKSGFRKEHIIVAHQHHSLGDQTYSKLPQDILDKATLVDWLAYGTSIEYARIIQRASEVINTEYIWIHDAYTYLPFHEAIRHLRKVPKDSAIKPYGRCYYLNKESTDQFVIDGSTDSGAGDNHYKMDGEISYIFRKEDFLNRYESLVEDEEKLWGLHQIIKMPDLEVLTGSVAIRLFTGDLDIKYNCSRDEAFDAAVEEARDLKRHRPKGRIIHVISPTSKGGPDSISRQKLAIRSINKAFEETTAEVVRIMVIQKDDAPIISSWDGTKQWLKMLVTRDARSIGHIKDQPFLKDLFDEADLIAKDFDYLFYTNSDICIKTEAYNKIISESDCYGEFYRHDIPMDVTDLEDVLAYEGELLKRGIDGILFRKDFYQIAKRFFPDIIVGEPFWEPPLAGTMRCLRKPFQDTDSLLHHDHPRTWSVHDLNTGSKHNLNFLGDQVLSGRSMTNNSDVFFDDLVVCIVHELDKELNYNAYRNFRNQVYRYSKDYTVVIIELMTNESRLSFFDVSMYPFSYLQAKRFRSAPDTAKNIVNVIRENFSYKRVAFAPVNFQFNDDTPASIDKAFNDMKKGDHPSLEVNDVKVIDSNSLTTDNGVNLVCEVMMDLAVDTAVIIPFWIEEESNQRRLDALSATFNALTEQNGRFKIVIVEAIYGTRAVPEKIIDHPDVQYVPVRAYAESKGIFQKESLINIAVGALPPEFEYLIFLDADVCSTNQSFVMETRREFGKHKYAINQPGIHVIEIKHNKIRESSARLLYAGLASIRDRMVPSHLQDLLPECGFLGYHHFNPGICWAMTRSMFRLMGGLNVWGSLVGGGDSLILYEGIKDSRIHTSGTNKGWFSNVHREIETEGIYIAHPIVKGDFVHVWHGDKDERPYHLWWEFLNRIDFNPKDYMQETESGLLKWVFKPPLLQEFIKNKERITEEDIEKMIESHQDDSLFIFPAKYREDQNYILGSTGINLVSLQDDSDIPMLPVCCEQGERYLLISTVNPDENFRAGLCLNVGDFPVSFEDYSYLSFRMKTLYADDGENSLFVSAYGDRVPIKIIEDAKWHDISIPLKSFGVSTATAIVFTGAGGFDIVLSDIKLIK